VRAGRYGPYENHGKINATLPKDTDPDTIALDQAVALLAARAAAGPARTARKGNGKAKAAPKTKKAATTKAAASRRKS
jgi:DNA topoisomerase-1